jgi:hypothetical protein
VSDPEPVEVMPLAPSDRRAITVGGALIGLLAVMVFVLSVIALPGSTPGFWAVVTAFAVMVVANIPYERWLRRRYPFVCHRCGAVFHPKGLAYIGWFSFLDRTYHVARMKCPRGHWAPAHMVNPLSMTTDG